MEFLYENNFTQVVTKPTRLNNILDLFMTTNPTLIIEVKCQPGLGDHDMVSAESMLKPVINKQKPRTAFLFQKADWAACTLKLKMKQFQESFLLNCKIQSCIVSKKAYQGGKPRKRIGPRAEPWEIPEVTGMESDSSPSVTTLWDLPPRKA